MTHEEFVGQLPDQQKQFVTELMQEISSIAEVTTYHTNANGGDFRVRIGDAGRVLFTMYWQRNNETYFCRCFVETQYLSMQPGLFGVTLEPEYEPQISSFRFKANYINTMSVLTNLIRESVKRYQFFLQNKAKK